MSRHTLLSLSALLLSSFVDAQTTTALEPLSSKVVPFNDIPYQVTGDQGGPRGPQFGYNLCNSTTQNQQSLCQTLIVNNIMDFCMWSSSIPNDTISESEQREIAWCTSPTHGTRVIPPGAITGLQWLYAENYVQIVGFLDQTQVNLNADDSGGELDDFGADEQGNPLGALVYTNALTMNTASFDAAFKAGELQGNTTGEAQNIFWVDFIGNGLFCIKLCNPDDSNAANLCNHVYDEIGCTYNAVADYDNINGTYTVCDSTDMTQPGQYVNSEGVTTTWFQPLNGPLGVVPYTPTQVSSSNCQTYSSEQLFAAAATFSAFSSSASGSAPTGSGITSHSGSGATSGSGSGSAGASQTGSADTNGSSSHATTSTLVPFLIAGFMTMFATVFTMLA